YLFFFSSRRRHTSFSRDWSSDVCSSDLASPEAIILSKILYNSILTLVLALLGYVVFGVIMGNPIQDQPLFLLNLVVAALGFSGCLTMVSGIASKAGNNATLMAILS